MPSEVSANNRKHNDSDVLVGATQLYVVFMATNTTKERSMNGNIK